MSLASISTDLPAIKSSHAIISRTLLRADMQLHLLAEPRLALDPVNFSGPPTKACQPSFPSKLQICSAIIPLHGFGGRTAMVEPYPEFLWRSLDLDSSALYFC